MSAPISLLIGEDDAELRSMLLTILGRRPELRIVADVGDGGEALEAALRLRPDIALLDVRMPVLDGVSVAQRLRAAAPSIVVVLYTAFAQPGLSQRAIDAGVRGILSKDLPPDLLIVNLLAAYSGTRVVSPSLEPPRPFAPTAPSGEDPEFLAKVESLPQHLLPVLIELAQAKSNREIARALSISEGSARTYVSRLIALLGCSSRTEVAVRAQSVGLTPASDDESGRNR